MSPQALRTLKILLVVSIVCFWIPMGILGWEFWKDWA
jgi:hypothetical protein